MLLAYLFGFNVYPFYFNFRQFTIRSNIERIFFSGYTAHNKCGYNKNNYYSINEIESSKCLSSCMKDFLKFMYY